VVIDDLGQIGRSRFLWDNCGGVRNVAEQRAVGKERTARHEDDSCLGPPEAGEIGGRYHASVVQHDIEDKHLGRVAAKEFNRFVLGRNDVNFVVLPFEMLRPNGSEFGV